MALLVGIWREWQREVELADEAALLLPLSGPDAPAQGAIGYERTASKTYRT